MHTVAGDGTCSGLVTSGGPCDNVKATSVPILRARSVAAVPGGGFLYIDYYNHLVRQVSPSGVVQTVAGNGTTTDAADNTVAVSSGLDDPTAVAPLPGGGFLVTESTGSVVRMVSPGPPGVATIATIAGTGTAGSLGLTTTGPATSAQLNSPTDAELTPDGRVLIADTYNNAIRILSAPGPGATISTIAGGGACDDSTTSCEGMAASAVALHRPVSVSPIQNGPPGYLVAEDYSTVNAVRQISDLSSSGTFTTVAGSPGQTGGYSGDGGPATSALLYAPQQVMTTPDGGFLIADTSNERIRAVSPAGTITTVAGTGVATYAGDGGDAASASLQGPDGLAPGPDGGFMIADGDNDAIREVTIPPTTTTVLSPGIPNGQNGWYVTKVHVSLSVVNGVKSNCSLDPTIPLTVFAALPTSCGFKGAGADVKTDGIHTLYVGSVDAFGDQEIPVSTSFKVDITPPVVTCNATPVFPYRSHRAVVTATVTDPTSGPLAPQAGTPVPAQTWGDFFTGVVGTNLAGVSTTASCPFTVLPALFRPTPRLKWSFGNTHGRTVVRSLVASAIPGGATVRVTCRDRKWGCPFSKRSRSRRGTWDLTPLFKGAQLTAGAQVKVTVTKENTMGVSWTFAINATKGPAVRAGCQFPASFQGPGAPTRCPAGITLVPSAKKHK